MRAVAPGTSTVGGTAGALVALDPAAMHEILERHLQPAAGGCYEVCECRIATARGGGGRTSVQYDLRLADPATGGVFEQVVSGVVYDGERAGRIWETLRDAEPVGATAADRSSLPPFAYVPELGMLLQVFPHDHRLQALARLMAGPPPELVDPMLAAFGAGRWRLARWRAESVRYCVDLRRTLRLWVAAHEAEPDQVEERSYFAKVYRDDGEGHRGYSAQRDLHAAVAVAGAPFAVAEPVVYADGLRTLVQAEVPGTPLQAILRRQGARCRRCGRRRRTWPICTASTWRHRRARRVTSSAGCGTPNGGCGRSLRTWRIWCPSS